MTGTVRSSPARSTRASSTRPIISLAAAPPVVPLRAASTSSTSSRSAPAERDEHVPEQQPTLFGRRAGLDRDEHQSGLLTAKLLLYRVGQADRLRADPQVAAPHAAAAEELVDDAIDRRGRHRDGRRARERRRVDAEHPARGIDERPAGEPVVDRDVEANELIDLAAVPGAPGRADGRDDAECRGDRVSGATEREGELADVERVADERRRSRRRVVELEHDEVGPRVAADDGAAGGRAAIERDADVVVLVHRVVRGDDESRTPDDARGGDAPTRVDGDDRAAGRLDGGGEIGGECFEDCWHGVRSAAPADSTIRRTGERRVGRSGGNVER